MKQRFKMHGTCASEIQFQIEDDKVSGVRFKGGCDGNLQAVAKLVEGRPPEEVISMLKGIRCGRKRTSCPDQLSMALMEHVTSTETETEEDEEAM